MISINKFKFKFDLNRSDLNQPSLWLTKKANITGTVLMTEKLIK